MSPSHGSPRHGTFRVVCHIGLKAIFLSYAKSFARFSVRKLREKL